MNKIPNRKAICDVLLKEAETDKDIVVLCSDSRGSASLAPFAEAYPEQFVEMGIAEQDLVSVSAGLVHRFLPESLRLAGFPPGSSPHFQLPLLSDDLCYLPRKQPLSLHICHFPQEYPAW